MHEDKRAEGSEGFNHQLTLWVKHKESVKFAEIQLGDRPFEYKQNGRGEHAIFIKEVFLNENQLEQ